MPRKRSTTIDRRVEEIETWNGISGLNKEILEKDVDVELLSYVS